MNISSIEEQFQGFWAPLPAQPKPTEGNGGEIRPKNPHIEKYIKGLIVDSTNKETISYFI